ncbi:MAG: peptidylprolyl isomerase [Candidatus Marinimicrobia bacterium]|nr:peptidylprolyl isomerase [Candidatus Neomarinimicrobiota bacterium]
MGVMQNLREQTHVILWGVLILFLLSMTIGGLVGGADILSLFSKDQKNLNLAGKIDDREIDIRTFSDALNYQTQQYRDQGREIDSRTMDMLSDRVWNSIVNEILMDQQVDEYGFQASDEEVYQSLVTNPPSILRQHPAFITDGKFDYQKYYQVLSNPQGDEWLPFEYQLRVQLPMAKVAAYIQSLATVTEAEIKDEYLKKKINYTLEALSIPIAKVTREEIEVTDKEIEERYNKNKEDYLQEETRDLKYVSFPIVPSKSDSQSVEFFAKDLIDRITTGENFEDLAAEFTEDPSGAETGGDLGWFGEGRMVKPFSDACFNAKKGDLVGPVLTQFGYHIIKVEDFRETDGNREVHARHILLKIKIGPETQNAINSQANLFAYDANEMGFEAAADTFKVEIKTISKLDKNSKYVTGLGYLPSVTRFAFSDKPIGSLSQLLSTENAFVLFKLEKVNPKHYQSLEEVKNSISSVISKEKREAKLKAIADEVLAEIKAGKSFTEIKETDPKYVFSEIPATTLDKPLANLGSSNELTGAIIAMEKGQVSKPIYMTGKYVIVKLLDKSEFDQADYDHEKAKLKDELLTTKKGTYYTAWMQALTDAADIFDNRANVF